MPRTSRPSPSSPSPVLRSAAPLLAALLTGSVAAAQGTCATGAATLQTFASGCFPADCVSTAQLDFGSDTPETLLVPKFDPALGTLLEVRVRPTFDHLGAYCVDNGGTSCAAVELSARLVATVQPSADNLPPVTGLSPLGGDYPVDLLAPGFLLGASDGVDDCATPTGPPSNGDCLPGEDHVVGSFDTQHLGPEAVVSGAGLAAWVAGAAGEAVAFEAGAQGALSGSSGTPVSLSFSTQGAVRVDVTYVYCPTLGTVYCDCAGISPCGNVGQGGTGCANSTGLGARLGAGGTASLAAGDLVLLGSQLPPGRPGVFLSGSGASLIGASIVLGGGALCTVAPLTRLEVVFADANGDCASSVDLGAGSGGVAGLPSYFQLWYRDAPTAPCGGGSNTTNGLEIVWAP